MAANTQINYSVGLKVDTREAKASMQDLMKLTASLANQKIEPFDADSLREGVAAAKDLQKNLRQAFNVNTGNLDLTKFATGLKKSGESINSLQTKLSSLGLSGSKAFDQLANSIISAQVPLKRTSTMIDSLMINLKKTAQWQVSSTLIHGAVGQMEAAVNYVKNLNESLTNISIVSELSSKELANFAVQAQNMGKSLKASTLDVTNAALIYFQQGDNVLQAMEKAAITIKAANASANSSAAEMSEYLTAIWNSYQVGSAELERYVDVMAALGAKTATSMEEIATSMQKVAATANTVGVSFGQMSSIISTVSSVTRESAESIGTSYKTILARIGDLKLGTLVEDGATVTLGQVSGQLKEIGINILDAKGDMRDMGAVIEEIGTKWQGMNDAQKAAVAQAIAGKRQYTQLMALFENWDQYQMNFAITEGSAGALQEMQNKWAEGWEAASKKVKNAMQGIYSDLIPQDFAVGFLNVIAEIISGIDSVIDKMGGLGGIITMVGGALMSKFGNRTHELVSALKTNLGLALGITKKTMVQMNQELAQTEKDKAKEFRSKADGAKGTPLEASYRQEANKHDIRAQEATHKAKYLANQDDLSMDQRQNFEMHMEQLKEANAEATRLAEEREQIVQRISNLQEQGEQAFASSDMMKTATTMETSDESLADKLALIDTLEDELETAGNELGSNTALAEGISKMIQSLDEGNTDEAREAGKQISQALQKGLTENLKTSDTAKEMSRLTRKARRQSEEALDKEKALKKSDEEIDKSDISDKDKQALKKKNDEARKALLEEQKAKATELASSLVDTAGDDEALSTIADIKVKIEGADSVEALNQVLQELETQLNEVDDAATNAAQNTANMMQRMGNTTGQDQMNAHAEKAATEDEQADVAEQMEAINEELDVDTTPVTTFSDAFVSLTGNVLSAVAAVSAFGSSWSTITDEDATPIEKVTAALTALMSIMTMVTSAQQALTNAKKMGQKFDLKALQTSSAQALADARAAMQKRMVAAASRSSAAASGAEAAANTAEAGASTAQAAAEGLSTGAKIKGVAITLVQTVKTIALTAAKWAQFAAEVALAAITGQYGKIAAAAAIIVGGLAVATIAATTASIAQTEAERELDEEQQSLAESSAKLQKKQKESANVLVTLASVINNTSLTLEEQKQKIDELTSKYGIQASAVDLLAGKYGNLTAQITGAVAAEQAMIEAQLHGVYGQQTQNSAKQAEHDDDNWYDWFFTGVGAVAGAVNWGLGWIWDGDTSASDRYSKTYDSVKTAERTNLDTWGENNSVLTDTNEMDKWREFSVKNADQLSEIGMYWDAELGQLRATRELTGGDYQQLYDMLEGAGVDDWGVGEGSYTAEMLNQMRGDWGMDLRGDTQQAIDQAELIQELLSPTRSTEVDLLNLQGTTKTMEDLNELISSMGITDLEDQNYIADYLSQFEHWSEAGTQFKAINEYAADMVQVSDLPEGMTEADVAEKLRTAVLNGEDGLSLDLLLKLNPTDITIDENGKINISESAKALAQAELDKEGAIEVQTKIKTANSYAEKDTLTREDYTALQDLELFSDEELDEFVMASPASRALMLAEMQAEAEAEEIEAIRRIYEASDTRIEELAEAKTEYMESLAAAVNDTALAGKSYLFDEQGNSLTGEALYNALSKRQQEIQNIQAYRASYGSMSEWDDDTMDEEKAAAYKEAALSTMTAEQLEQYGHLSAKEIFEAREDWQTDDAFVTGGSAELTLINDLIAEGTELLGAYSEAQAANAKAQGDLEAAEWWETTGKAIETATKGAKAFGEAIGEIGSLDAEALAQLMLLDPENALKNYQTMSSSEWNEYAYEQSMAYYNDLAALYDKDSADYALVMQEKEAVTKNYYDALKAQREAAAQEILNTWDTEKKAVEESVKTLKDLLSGTDLNDMSFESIEKIRQGLLEVGYTAEEVDAILRNLGKEETDEASIIEAAKLKTNLLLRNMGNARENASAIDGLLGDQTSVLTVRTDINHEGLAADGDGGYSATLTTDPEDGTRTLTLKSNTTKVLGLKNHGDGTYSVTYSLNGEPSQTLTLSDDVDLTDLHKNDNDEVVVSYTTPDGEDHTLTLGEEFGLSKLAMDGNSVKISYTTPDGEEHTLALDEDFDLKHMKMSNNKVILTYSIDGGSEHELSLDEDVSLEKLSMDENNNVTVHYTTPDGVFRKMWLSEGVTLSKLHLNDDGDVEVGYYLPDGKEQIFTLSGGATIEKADYNPDTKTWTILTSNGETVTFDGTMTGNGWSEKDGKYVYTTTGGITVEASMVTAEGSDEIPEDGEVRSMTYKVNYQSDLDAIIQMRKDMKAAWEADGQEEFLDKFSGVDFTNMTKELMNKYEGDIAAYAAATGKSKKDIGANIASIGTYVDKLWQKFLTQANGDQAKAWELASQDSGFMYGYNLYAGLVNGYQSAYGDYSGAITGVSTSLLDRIRVSLGEHSPSKYTHTMGEFLMIGLQEGFDSVDFDASGLQEKILQPIQDALIAAGDDIDAQIAVLEGKINQFDPEVATAGEIEEVEVTDEEGVTHTRYKYNGTEYVNREDAETEQRNNRMAYSAQAGYSIVEQAGENDVTQYGVQYAGEVIKWFDSQNEAIVHAYMSSLSDNAVAESLEHQLSTGIWDDQFSVLQQHYLNQASDDAFKEINAQYENRWTNIAELLASGNQEAIDAFYSAFNANVSKIGQELEGDVNLAWAQIQDTWADGFATIFKGEQDLAQKTYDLWVDTFNSIVAAREAIIEGKDWSGLSSQDKINLYRGWQKEEGITTQDIMQRTFSTSKNRTQYVQFDPYYNKGNDPDATYGSSVVRGPDGLVVISDAATAKTRQQTAITTQVTEKMESGGLVWNYRDALPILNDPAAWRQAQVEGNATYKQWAADEANAGKTWNDWLTTTDEGKSFGVDLETNEAMAATLASLDDTLITFDETIGTDGTVSRTYRLKDGAPEDAAPQAGFEDDIAAKVVAYLMGSWTDEGFYDYQARELDADATYLGEIRSLQQKEYETKIETNQGYQKILDDAYNAGGVQAYLDSFEDPAERQAAWTDLSEAYEATTGETLTLNTSLDDLETASKNAASAVTKFSNALLWIMDKVVSGYTDFQMDEKTGVVTAKKTYGDVTYNADEDAYYSGNQKIELAPGQSYGTYDATAGTLVVQASSVTLPGYSNQPEGMTTDQYEAGMSEAANAGQSATDVWHQTHDYDWEAGFNQANSQFSAMSNMNGIDPMDFEAWTSGIESLSSAYAGMGDAQAIIDQLRDGTIDWATANEQLTSITLKAGRGIGEMTDLQYDQWKQMLKNNKVTVQGYKTLNDYFKACDKARQIQKDMNKLVKQFTKNMRNANSEERQLVDNLKDSQKAWTDLDEDGFMDAEELDFDKSAWDDLFATLVPEEFQGVADEIAMVFDQFGGDWDAAIRAGFDTTTYTFNESTKQLLTAMGLNAQQITDLQEQTRQALEGNATMGDINFLSMIADMDVNNVPFDSMIESLNNAMRQIYAAAADMGIELIPATWEDIPTLASQGVGAHGGGGSSGGGDGNNGQTNGTPPGGGGGGGGDPQKKDYKESDDEIERYHEIQEEMKRTSEALDQIEKHKERAYGKKYLNLMDQEIEKLKENIEEQQRYQDEIAGYLAQDRQAVAALGAQFDAEGNITNYTQVMQSIIDDYNAAVEQYNAGNMTDEEFEDIEEQYEDAVEALEQYEETLELSAEAQAEFLELQNQLSAANLEKITYKMEIVTELNDADLEILQYYQETYEDNLDKQDDLMRNLTQQAQEYESNILVLNNAMAELQAKFAAGEINEADFAEGMQELRDQAIGYAGDLEDLKDQVVEVYENALDLAAEEVGNFTEKMQDSADMMDTYISLTQLMGRGTNYRELEKFYDTQYKANLANLETQRAYVDSLEEQAAYFEEQMEKNGELTATEQEQYEALQDALREANSELASTTEAALSSLQAAYENSINAIFKELDANIAGTAGSLADLADQYAYYQEEQARYVSTAKELFEISKLNRSIEQSLEDATTDASKAKLKALQDEINYISEKNDLTEYDIEMMNLQYQLTLAQIALEEAQASKDTVRLTRDQDGNMAYQYTANQDKVNQAQQEYENVLQQINDLAANRVSELEQQCLDAEQQYLQSAQEILLDTTLTDEQRTKKLEELSQRYSETLLFIQGQYNNASQALTQNQQAVAEHYGQALVNSMGEASLQMNTVIGDMIGNAQNHIDAFNQAIESGSMGAWSEYMDGVKALTNASGLTYDNLIANADDYAKVADDANKAAQELIKTFDDSFEDINKATEQWDAHLATLEGVQKMYENIATSAQNTLEVLSGFTGSEGVGDTTAAIAALLGITPANTSTEGVPDNLITAPRPPVTLQEEAQTMIEGWTDEYLDQIMQVYEEVQAHIGSSAIGEYAEAGSGTHAGGGRKWNDQIAIQEYQMIQQGLMEQLHNFYAAQDGFAHASGYGVAGGGASGLEQHVEITADFPNATNQEEIRMAFEELINLASQHVYSSASLSKNR